MKACEQVSAPVVRLEERRSPGKGRGIELEWWTWTNRVEVSGPYLLLWLLAPMPEVNLDRKRSAAHCGLVEFQLWRAFETTFLGDL